jgi:hypothetical protein
LHLEAIELLGFRPQIPDGGGHGNDFVNLGIAIRENPLGTTRDFRLCCRETGTSVIVLIEIRSGIELKRRHDPERARSLDRWFSRMRTRLGDRVLPIDEPIAESWVLLAVPDPLPLIDGLCRNRTASARGISPRGETIAITAHMRDRAVVPTLGVVPSSVIQGENMFIFAERGPGSAIMREPGGLRRWTTRANRRA